MTLLFACTLNKTASHSHKNRIKHQLRIVCRFDIINAGNDRDLLEQRFKE